MKVIRNPQLEPEWDTIGITAIDFRPHFDDDFVNAFTFIYPAKDRSETEQSLFRITREMATWILAHREEFGRGDGVQLIVGWPKSIRPTARQIIKTGGAHDALAKIADGTTTIVPFRHWDNGIFPLPTP